MKKELKEKEKQPAQDWSDIHAFIRALGNFSLVIIAMIGYIFAFFSIAEF
jgi:hypothetical protein